MEMYYVSVIEYMPGYLPSNDGEMPQPIATGESRVAAETALDILAETARLAYEAIAEGDDAISDDECGDALAAIEALPRDKHDITRIMREIDATGESGAAYALPGDTLNWVVEVTVWESAEACARAIGLDNWHELEPCPACGDVSGEGGCWGRFGGVYWHHTCNSPTCSCESDED